MATNAQIEFRILTRSGKIARKPWLVVEGCEVVSRHRQKGEAFAAAQVAS